MYENYQYKLIPKIFNIIEMLYMSDLKHLK